jgi:hypothetical protein
MNKALKIFGSKREAVTKGWKKLHKEFNLHSLLIITVMNKTRIK